VADRALLVGKELRSPFLSGGTVIALYQRAQVFHDAIESHEVISGGVYLLLINADLFQRAVHQFIDSLLGDILKRSLDVTVILLQNRLDLPEDHLIFVFSQRSNGTLMNRQLRVRNHLLHVNLADHAKPLAVWAGALGRVEREDVWCRIAVGKSCLGIHQPLGEVAALTGFFVKHHNRSVALPHGRGDGLCQPLAVVGTHTQFVDDHLDIVVFVSVGLHSPHDFLDLTIHAHIEIALAAQALEELAIVTLTLADKWSENIDRLAGILMEDHFHDLFLGIFHHLLSTEIAVGSAGTSVEQTQIVIDLRGGAHGGAWIFIGGFLLNADDRAQSRDLVDIGPLHVAQKVTGIGREGLDIASLSFGIDGVKGQ